MLLLYVFDFDFAALSLFKEIFVNIPKKANFDRKQKIVEKYTNGGICPLCGGNLYLRSDSKGEYIGCINSPDCKYRKDL